jgi:hypothetical protein
MAIETPCQTPGAIFHTKITSSKISLSVDLPTKFKLTAKEAKLLEANLHNAMELVLSPLFIKKHD